MKPITAAVLAVLWLTAAAAPLPAQAGHAGPPPEGVWQEAPVYVRMFGAAGARAAAYRTFVSRLSLDALLKPLAAEPSLLHAPGSWTPAGLIASDAFGQTGTYDRSKLARLYGATRAAVARGPRVVDGRPVEAWTLISPYPSSDMQRLEPGTLLIVLDLEFP